VIAVEGMDGIGATVSASGVDELPLAHLRTTSSSSLVLAVGNELIGPVNDDPPT
jgi:hypothetical protein